MQSPIEDLKKIYEEASAKQPPQSNEAKQARLERAIRLSEMMKTEAGQELMAHLQRLDEGCIKPPDLFLRRTQDGTYAVDQILLATWVGYRNGVQDIMHHLKACDTLISEEAKRASSSQASQDRTAVS